MTEFNPSTVYTIINTGKQTTDARIMHDAARPWVLFEAYNYREGKTLHVVHGRYTTEAGAQRALVRKMQASHREGLL